MPQGNKGEVMAEDSQPAEMQPIETQSAETRQPEVQAAEGTKIFQRIGNVLDRVFDSIKEWLSSLKDKAKEASEASAAPENSVASRTDGGTGEVTTMVASKGQPDDMSMAVMAKGSEPVSDAASPEKFADKITASREAQAAVAQQAAGRN